MIQPLYPCLWFNGEGRAAFDLYASVFPNSILEQENEQVLHFTILDKKIMALNGGQQYAINPSISFFVTCNGQAETERVWQGLSDGAEVMMPLGSYAWSPCYGWLRDRYGMTWQLMMTDPDNPLPQLRPCLLFTGPVFGKAEAALRQYVSVFPRSEQGVPVYYPEGDIYAGKLMFGECTLNGTNLVFMDGPGEHAFRFSEGVSLVVACDTQEEIDHCWNRLLEKGGEEQSCGWMKDAYGVSWQIIPAKLGAWMEDPVKGPELMKAFLQMQKPALSILQSIAG